jgi:hypothetical protein
MLRITADVYSGQPNPAAEIFDEGEARALLGQLQRESALLADTATADSGLGFRGFRIEPLGDEIATDYEIPSTGLYLPARTLGGGGRGAEIGERLLALMAGEQAMAAEGTVPLDSALRDYVVEELRKPPSASAEDRSVTASTEESVAVTCTIELGAFNPGFWNAPNVQPYNNCYNYASNWRTNSFAQPGKGCGHQYTAITCPEVTRAALCDGVHRRFDCFPDTEKPRYLVALVVAPGPGFRDYHWYRKQSGGFWGHKPGGTAARNTDNSGALITNPETANRGPYTQFCGYFYTCNSQRIRIR